MAISEKGPEGTNGWVKVSKELFEYLANQSVPGIGIEWGEPDADGMLFPVVLFPVVTHPPTDEVKD